MGNSQVKILQFGVLAFALAEVALAVGLFWAIGTHVV